MVTDVIGVGMALAAIQLASRGTERRHRTFGLYRLEILAALANALLLAFVACYVVVEAIRRIGDAPDVDYGTMLIVAVAGLVVNLVAFGLLRAGSKESLNVEGAYLEVLSDTVGSVAVIAGRGGHLDHRVVMGRSRHRYRHRGVDPAPGVAPGGSSAAHRHAVAPPGLDLDAIAGELWRSTESSMSMISTCGR